MWGALDSVSHTIIYKEARVTVSVLLTSPPKSTDFGEEK